MLQHLIIRCGLAFTCVWLAANSFGLFRVQSQTQRQRTIPSPPPTPAPVAPSDKIKVPAVSPTPPAAPKTNPVSAQEQTVENSGETFRFNSSLVAVPVSVTDENGLPVRNLRADDFRLEEDGTAQQLQSLGAPGQTPLEMALLFDVSGSVRERFDFERLAALRFLQEVLKPQDTVTVFSIGFDPRLVVERSGSFDEVVSGLNRLQPTKEGTAFFDTVVKAAQYLNDNAAPGTRRVLVVISDGEDNQSEGYRLADAQRELQRSDTLFYSINPSGPSIRLNKISLRGHSGMSLLANETGGMAFLPDRDEDLERVFKQIAAELQAQYLLGYYPSNETTDGQFRRIRVRLPKYPQLRLRARQGYYAPKS